MTKTTPEPTPAVPRRHGRRAALSRVPRIIGVAVLAMLLSAATFVSTVYQGFSQRLQANSSDISGLIGDTRPEIDRSPTDSWEGQALNLLVLGSDSRSEGDGDADTVDGMRSDTSLLVHIAADRSRVEVISIPRDLIVEIPSCALPSGGHTRHRPLGTNEHNGTRFNVAFAVGSQGTDVRYGAACAIKAVEAMTDLFIDDWAVIDMSGFRTMVDAMGGVPMCIDEPINNRWANLKLDAGCQTLNGKEALGFARARKGIGDGSDIGRIGRQQELMSAMATQTLSAGVLANPSRLIPLLEAVADSLTTGPRVGRLNDLAGLAYSLSGVKSGDIHFITPPLGYEGNVVLQTRAMEELWEKIRNDEPLVDDGPELGDGESTEHEDGSA